MRSLVSCTWNRAEQTKRGLLTVINQEDTVDEIILVDDGSRDNTKDVADFLQQKAEEKGIKFRYYYLDHPEARISSIPRNYGFKQAMGDIVFFAEPEILHVGATINQAMDSILNARVPLATQIWTMGQRIWHKLPDRFFSNPQLMLGHDYAMLVSGNMQNTKAPDADWGITGSNDCYAGCFFGVKRDWFEAVGGFDESFEGHGYDDWDLFERLNMYGKSIEKRNDIVVIHQWHEKNYPYNIYDMAEKNGTASKENVKNGDITANRGIEWGLG